MTSSGPGRELPSPTADAQLLDWLLDALQPTNRTRVKELLRNGRVLVNDRPASRHDQLLVPGDRVAIVRDGQSVKSTAGPPRVPVVYADDALLVVDKPSGLLTVATASDKTDTAFARLSSHLRVRKAGRPYVVHRLDRDTSGLLLFARAPEIRDRLQLMWEQVTKTYLAVVEGAPRADDGVVETFLTEGPDLRVRVTPASPDAKWAVTRYRVRSTRGRYTLLGIGLETGRKHQIRVHLAKLGCPVVGDTIYRSKTDPIGRLGLHAWRLALDHPVESRRVELESALPAKLQRIVG